VIEDDDDDESPEKAKQADAQAEEEAERAAREFAAAEARARERARKRQEEVARQARERQAAERAEAAAEKARQRKANSKKAQKELLEEMRRKQEEEAAQREHHARKAQTEQKIREKARSTCVATATDEIYEAHVAAFEKMKTVPPGTLRERDIPWPHPNNLVFLTPRDDQNAKKKKVMRAIQRWHPDKFTQNFGAAIREDERERIMTRVRGVSASVIELRQVWN
jgi:multidrug efflux pump subunit AcrA (membrane-fusion protein)